VIKLSVGIREHAALIGFVVQEAAFLQVPSVVPARLDAVHFFNRDLANFTGIEIAIHRIETQAVRVTMTVGINLIQGIGVVIRGEWVGPRDAIFPICRDQVGAAGSQ
jgi:hypothetical protein